MGLHLKIILLFLDIYPTDSSHGGTGFYLKKNIYCIETPHVTLSLLLLKYNFQREKFNRRCIYIHPTSQISIHYFNGNHMNPPILQNISDGNKQWEISTSTS